MDDATANLAGRGTRDGDDTLCGFSVLQDSVRDDEYTSKIHIGLNQSKA